MAPLLLHRVLQGGAVAVVAAMALSTPAVALDGAAAADQTPPVVNVDLVSHFTRWSQVDVFSEDGVWPSYWYASYFVKWKTSDPSGICKQSITESSYDSTGSSESDPVLGDQTITHELSIGARRYDFRTDNDDNMRGPERFVVRATDCAGNTGTSGIATTGFLFVDDRDAKMTYTGRWRNSSFAGFAFGTSRWSTKAGDRVVIAAPPGAVGLVMESKYDRGAVDVYVDGAFRATVDTYSATTKHQTVVWEAFLKMGRNHTITVVNKGLPGRPRVDIDGLVTSHLPIVN